jgi:hypothetical protein
VRRLRGHEIVSGETCGPRPDESWEDYERRVDADADADTKEAFERLPTEQLEGETVALLDELIVLLRRFIVWSFPEQVDFVALWVMHTWVFEVFDATPYLDISAASKRAGKTRLLCEVLPLVVCSPWTVFDASEAVLFRKVDAERPTLLVDEVDAIFGKDSKLTEGVRAIFNAGYKRSATAARCVGNSHDFVDFKVYCPKAFAGLDGLPDTVRDRSARIELRRRAPHEPKPERLRSSKVTAETLPLRMRLRAWAAKVSHVLAGADPVLPELASDRAAEVCEVIVAVADLAGDGWATRARHAIVTVMGLTEDEGDRGVVLLAHIREAFDAEKVERLSTARLLRHLVDRGDDSPWAGWWGADIDRGEDKRPAMRLARMLKPYGIGPKQVRVDGEKTRGYERADFEDSWARYLPSSAPHPSFPEKVGTTVRRSSAARTNESEVSNDQGGTDVPTFSVEWVGMHGSEVGTAEVGTADCAGRRRMAEAHLIAGEPLDDADRTALGEAEGEGLP